MRGNSMAFLQRTVFVHIFLMAFVGHTVCIVNRDLMAIDVNDILSEKLMPLSLIYVKESSGKLQPPDPTIASNQTLNHSHSFADFNSAFNLMQFHRKMIQKYKCNKYIARQILTDIAPHTLYNRLGMADINSTGFDDANAMQQHSGTAWNGDFDAALLDQGSSAYKSWLTKVALLDDVYKQIKVNNVSGTFLDGDDAQPKPPFRRIDPAAVSAEHDEEVGVASGYAIQNPAPSGFVSPPQNHANDIDYDNYQRFAVAGNKAEKKPFPTAAYINNLNALFEPSHTSAAHSIQQHPIPSLQPLPLPPPPSSSLSPTPPHSVFLPEPTYEFRPPHFYPNLYTDPLQQPFPDYPLPFTIIEQHKQLQNHTTNDKMHKWWSFHSIKEKVKSFFRHRQNSKDETPNPMHTPDNQQQLWPGYSPYEPGYDYGMSYDGGGGGASSGHSSSSGKEMTLKKVYELALTAIAYLAFGIFVLQVIMCITTVKAQTGSNLVMMPDATEMIEMTEMRDGPLRRQKRSDAMMMMTSFSEINEMSRKVLMSIDAAMIARQDNGNCLKKTLCENSKFDKMTQNKIWLPVWSLGMSWLSSRLSNGQLDSPHMFECLKALTIGLGNGVCDQMFTCDSNLIANGRHSKKSN